MKQRINRPHRRRNLNKKDVVIRLVRRDGCRCAHCGRRDNLTIDHIKALSLGGTNNIRNLQLLCSECNNQKARHEHFAALKKKGVIITKSKKREGGWLRNHQSVYHSREGA